MRLLDAVRDPSPFLVAAATGYARALQAWERSGDDAALLGWIGRTARRYSSVDEVRGLLLAPLERGLTPEIGNRIAAVVEESWRPLRLRGSVDEADALIDDFIVSLEAVDTLTAEHSRAVGHWCARIARRLGFDAEATTFVRRAGLMHDIGKIHVPLAILAAPRSLSPSEWDVMRSHTTGGAVLLERVPTLGGFLSAVRSHHERMDGRGYPDGIPARRLPDATRIVSVADGFNAMIANRPYRRPMRPDQALEELQRSAGAHFDPDFVTALTDVVLHGAAPLDRLSSEVSSG